MKKILLSIILSITCIVAAYSQPAGAAAYRTIVTSGNWNNISTWQRSTNGGITWVSITSSSQIPSVNDSVFIQSGHTVNLTQDESCYDLNLGSATGTRINLSTYALNLYGRLRCVNSAINTWPVTYTSSNPSTVTWINSYLGGYINVVGNTRNLTNPSEWGNNPPGWIMQINLNSGQTVTTNTGLKLRRLIVNTGTLYTASTSTGGYDIRPDSGAALTGDIIVNAGATLSLGYTTARTSTAGAQFDSLVVNGVCELRAAVLGSAALAINALNLVVNYGGKLKMSNLVSYTYNVTNFSHNSGSYVEYGATAAQTVGGEWPATLVVRNLIMNNSTGLTIPLSRSVSEGLIMTSGNITIPSTDSLILGTTSTAVLTRTGGAIIGKINRFVGLGTTGNIVFPVGTATAYRPLATNFVSAPLSAGNISIFHVDNGTSSTACTGFTDGSYTINRRSNSYWQGYYNSSITGMNITLSADLSGQSGILNASETRIIASIDNGVSFGLVGGSHSAGSGTIAYRTGFVMGAGPLTVRIYFGGNATTNPLPVKIYNFNAKKINDHILVSWHTAFEQNNDHFEIEKSEDGIAFRTIEKYIKGSQNSNTLLKYEFMDVEKTISNVYYRIKQIDNDANYSYSNVIHYVNQSEIEVVFSPNPITDELVIASSKNIETEIEVYDISGKILFKSIYHDNLIQINTASFPTGVLFIKVNQNGMNTVKRVVKK